MRSVPKRATAVEEDLVQLADATVEPVERREDLVPDAREDPSLHDLHSDEELDHHHLAGPGVDAELADIFATAARELLS